MGTEIGLVMRLGINWFAKRVICGFFLFFVIFIFNSVRNKFRTSVRVQEYETNGKGSHHHGTGSCAVDSSFCSGGGCVRGAIMEKLTDQWRCPINSKVWLWQPNKFPINRSAVREYSVSYRPRRTLTSSLSCVVSHSRRSGKHYYSAQSSMVR